MIIDPTFSFAAGTTTADEIQFEKAVNYVISYYETIFIANVTLNINYAYGESFGSANNNVITYTPMTASPGSFALGRSEEEFTSLNYSTVVNALTADAVSPNQKSADSTIPSNSPFSASNLEVNSAEGKALGLNLTNLAGYDGVVGIISNEGLQAAGYTADWTTAAPSNSNQYYMLGTIEHETSEIMGRSSDDGTDVFNNGADFTVMDLFRYSAVGVRDTTPDTNNNTDAYFSINNGNSLLGYWNNVFSNGTSDGDLGDWAPGNVRPSTAPSGFPTNPIGDDAYLDNSSSGVINGISATDLELMNVIGWDEGNNVTAPTFPFSDTVSDFNGDGKSDVIFQNGGTFTEWQSTGNNFTPNVYVSTLGTGWSLAGIGDFNGDGKSDLIFQNGGTFTEWQSTGNSFTPNVSVFSVGAGWNLAGVGDFNGDVDDLIFQNGGTFTEWESTGNGFTPNVYVNTVGAGWRLAGVGDFNGDGLSDLIFQNSGTFTEWQSTGNGFTPNVYVNTVGAGWKLAGVGDFNGDGKSDLIFENGGTFTEWQSTGNSFTPNVYVSTLGAGWSVAAIGDFNGDGLSDILFRNTNGTFTEWQSTGSGFTQNVVVNSTVGNAWTLEYSPTGASGTPGAPAGLAASTTTLSASSSNSGEGGLITTDLSTAMLNQQSSLVANPPQLFGSHPA